MIFQSVEKKLASLVADLFATPSLSLGFRRRGRVLHDKKKFCPQATLPTTCVSFRLAVMAASRREDGRLDLFARSCAELRTAFSRCR